VVLIGTGAASNTKTRRTELTPQPLDQLAALGLNRAT
jgi:hypothetical protein